MTELSTEPVAIEAPVTPPPPPDPTPTTAATTAPAVEHTPGGWPVVPLALSGANSTVGAVAAAGLAGGPIAAMVAATGAVVLGTVAAARSRRPSPRRDARRAAARMAGRSAARSAGLRHGGTGAGGRSGSGSAGRRTGRSSGRSDSGRGQHGTRPTTRHSSTAAGLGKGGAAGHGRFKRAADGMGKGAGRVRQIRALRDAQQAAGGSRADRRAQTSAARRAVADARRNARATAGNQRTGRSGSAAGRLLGGAARRARAARDAAVARHRARRDARTDGTVAARRSGLRRAPARRAARQALRRSAARFHGRRLLAALLALPVGLLGLITTPLGRRLGWPWLMHPGRRLFWRLAGVAAEQRAARDEAIREQLAEQEAAADEQAAEDGTGGIADSVERPAATVPTSNTTSEVSEGENVSGFRFEEAAAEMEQAANSYNPDDCMEILAMVEGLPAALASVANVMRILAERSDSEFPLEKEVAAGFNDIFGALMSAVAVAEDMGPLFRQVHAQDIARHEDPRNGHEAEKGWNV
ncbi:hypothetical protein [Streptomyces sp. F-1]|uniref:hypothetical protein n=1 Tax=Streptomyces sp. F-1 TaxID=463642 RepID=UPI00085BF238|nr:hypothetical protein [Streptomyces sp. F-1]SFY53187.1 hypothetical protein STEPF1_06464 [Streptomyces sp. F-1]